LCLAILAQSGSNSGSGDRVIARGGGTTIIEGGTGSAGGFVPVLTKIGFHVERQGNIVSGNFECLALVPPVAIGPASGEFNVNAMYVTGQVRTVEVHGHIATLRGTATITGLGSGRNAPFEFVVQEGGPGAKAVLTTEGSQRLVFNEILLEGNFQVPGGSDD